VCDLHLSNTEHGHSTFHRINFIPIRYLYYLSALISIKLKGKNIIEDPAYGIYDIFLNLYKHDLMCILKFKIFNYLNLLSIIVTLYNMCIIGNLILMI